MMKPFGIDNIEAVDRLEIARRSLNNLLTSYADEADVFTEIIQNAYDSIKIAVEEKVFNESEFPELVIAIGRRSNGHHYLFVRDNGIGMSPDIANKLTVPGFSHGKARGKTIGYKGVGASYFFAASQCASLISFSKEGEKTEYTVRGSYDWIKNIDEPEPTIEDSFFIPNSLKDQKLISRGTAVYFQFHDAMNPSNLNNLVRVGDGPAKEIKNWMSYLSVKTSLGTVDSSGIKNLKIRVFLDRGDALHEQIWTHGEYDSEKQVIGYPFPQNVLRVGAKKKDIDETDSHLRHRHERRHQAIFHRWSAEEIIEDTSALEEHEKNALRDYLLWAEGYFCYSVDVLKEINVRLGGRGKVLRHGIRIACDGTPQGRMVDLSLTSSQGLDRQTHIVLAFQNLELDTGRKISADETIASSITKLGNRIVTVLKEYRWAMKKKDRPDVSSDLDSWRTDVESRAQSSIVKEFYKLLELKPAFKVDPDNESEVIGLFVSLVSQGMLLGYKLQAISGFARYDSLVDVDFSSEECTDIDSVLSVRNTEIKIDGKGKVLEFKYNFDDLLSDFEEKKKNPSEIDLVVCWNIADLNVARGMITATYSKWKDHRSVFGGSYVWTDENETSIIPILALKNIICEILQKRETELGEPGLGTAILKKLEDSDGLSLI